MRIGIVSAPPQRMAPPDYVLSLAKGMESMGHRADVIDMWTEDGFKLPAYEYIAVVSEPVSFFSGKLPVNIAKILSAGSSLGGKKSAPSLKKRACSAGGLYRI